MLGFQSISFSCPYQLKSRFRIRSSTFQTGNHIATLYLAFTIHCLFFNLLQSPLYKSTSEAPSLVLLVCDESRQLNWRQIWFPATGTQKR
jgi:hypothetical protein